MRQPVPFGKYLLLDRISVGGMAEVFKAKSYGVEGFEKIIAIKRILPTMGEDRDFIKMFIDEAKIAGQLAHANICQIFELGRIDGSHFIAMEYIWGKDLLQIQNRLRKLKQQMPIAMACFCIAKVLEGLDYAHRKRDPLGRPLEIVHRDCSPQNVLVSYEGEVKVIDFGIAKATSRNSRTMAGVLKGKFGYMSPEQVRGLPLDRRSDIFALGTMLYECLAGDRLFQGETDFSTLEKVRNVDIRLPREVNPNIPVAVEAVIMKALAKDVEERYQWCSEMLADLQAFLMSQDVVFTAKSLSSWLKDVFSGEIDRERQQLEQYKRVGRDGLISGLPAAEARGDVVENFGEAPQAEGDPTVLGGPNFDDIENIAAAAPEVGPAPGSPATRASTEAEEDSSEDFGEEAPTEIFGEIDHGANPVAALAAARAPSGSHPPQTRPPKPPPHRAPTSRGDLSPLPGMAGSPSSSGRTPPPAPGALHASPGSSGAARAPEASQSPYAASSSVTPGVTPGPQLAAANAQPIAHGTPGIVPVASNGQPVNQGQGRTLIGQAAPVGLANYANNYPPSGPYPGQQGQAPMPHYGQQGSGQAPMQLGQHGPVGQPMPPGQMMPMHPSQPMGPSGMPGFQGPPYPAMPHHPYGPPGQYNNPVPPIEQMVPIEGRKRSSIARDVAIGVAIAALVLGGFLAVKFLILDNDSPGEPAAPTSTYATIQAMLPAGESANLFVDDKKQATVSDKQEIQVVPGRRKLKLVGSSGASCERETTLVAGKTFALDCAFGAAPGSGSSAAVPATGDGSATAGVPAAGSGSAGGDGSAAGSGSAQGSGAIKAAGSDHPVPDKTDRMPAEDTAKPADQTDDKARIADKTAAKSPATALDKTVDKTVDKAPVKAVDKPPEKPTDKARPDRAPKPAPVEDDPLGKLSGGVKPGEKKPMDAKTDGDGKGYLTATTRPNAQVFVDGNDTGLTTPIQGHALPLSPGKHKILFVFNGGKVGYTVTIKAGETAPLNRDLR